MMRKRDATSLLGLAALAAGCASPPPPAPPPAPVDPPATQPSPAAPPPIAPRASATAAVTAPPPPGDHLDPRAIQSVIQQNFGSFRRCYEEYYGRVCCPNLQNRVTVRFVIGRDGRVENAVDAGSQLSDSETIACVVRAMSALRFPAPKGSPVTVSYPIMLQPGDG